MTKNIAAFRSSCVSVESVASKSRVGKAASGGKIQKCHMRPCTWRAGPSLNNVQGALGNDN